MVGYGGIGGVYARLMRVLDYSQVQEESFLCPGLERLNCQNFGTSNGVLRV